MKCQRNASPYSACFASRSCARFSPTTSTPASTSTAMSATRDVLRRRDDRHVRPDLRLDPLERARGSRQATQPITPCTPRARAVAPVREEELRVAARAEVEPLDLRDAGRAERALGRRPEVEHAVAASGRRRTASATSAPDLVAARPDRRPDHGGELGVVAERGDAGRDDPRGEPAPARVQRRRGRRAPARARSRSARSRRRARASAAAARRSRARRRLAPAPAGGAVHRARVHLAVDGERVRVDAERLAGRSAVLVDARGVVARRAAEVERGVRPLADAADARREATTYARLRPSGSSGSQLLRPLEQVVARVPRRARRRPRRAASWSVAPSAGPGAVAERDQVGAVDREIAQAVRAVALRSTTAAAREPLELARGGGSPAVRASRAGRRPCGRAGRTSSSVAVAGEQAPRAQRRRRVPGSNMWWRTIRTTRARSSFG